MKTPRRKELTFIVTVSIKRDITTNEAKREVKTRVNYLGGYHSYYGSGESSRPAEDSDVRVRRINAWRDQVRALTAREEAIAHEDEARRKLIECIDQWDSEMEYDVEDRASLADDILHAFNGPPVVSHEAPAEGAGDTLLRQWVDAFEGLGSGSGPLINKTRAYLARETVAIYDTRREEAPAEGAGDLETAWRILESIPAINDLGSQYQEDIQSAILSALRNRTSEPAREASAYRIRLVKDDPDDWTLMHPEAALDFMERSGWEAQPLYTHPQPAQTPGVVNALAILTPEPGDPALTDRERAARAALTEAQPEGGEA